MSVHYDTRGKFSVDPVILHEKAKKVGELADRLADEFVAIREAWEGISIGWSGRSKEEAESFWNTYNNAVADFFGRDTSSVKLQPGEPALEDVKGVLPRFAGAVANAAVIYDRVEKELEDAFRRFADQVTSPGGATGDGIRDLQEGPITEMTPGIPARKRYPEGEKIL